MEVFMLYSCILRIKLVLILYIVCVGGTKEANRRKPGEEGYPDVVRYEEPVLRKLEIYVKPSKTYERKKFLEISSGGGLNVIYIAQHLTFVDFQPTEEHKELLLSIERQRKRSGVTNIMPAQYLNVYESSDKWANSSITPGSLDYILNTYMLHLTPWTYAQSLFNGSAVTLKPNGYLFTYGPYLVDGKLSNDTYVEYYEEVRKYRPLWGLRDVTKELVPLGKTVGLHLVSIDDLPVDYKFLVWQKKQF